MSTSGDPPVPALEDCTSSSLSEAPSVLIPPSISSSSLSSVPETPSRRNIEANERHTVNERDEDDGTEYIEPEDSTLIPLTRQEKLDAIVKTLRRTRWSFEDMIEAWVGYSGQQDIRVQHRRYHKQKQRRQALMRVMRSLADCGICQDAPLDTRCASELDKLIRINPFSKHTVDMTLESIDHAQAAAVIHSTAPTWHALLTRLLSNRRHHRATYGAPNNQLNIQRRMFAVTSMVCFSRAQHTSNVFSSCLDVYFRGAGVPRHVHETLHGFGICHSYHHTNSLMLKVATHAAVRDPSTTP
jgi:hypothetical protein